MKPIPQPRNTRTTRRQAPPPEQSQDAAKRSFCTLIRGKTENPPPDRAHLELPPPESFFAWFAYFAVAVLDIFSLPNGRSPGPTLMRSCRAFRKAVRRDLRIERSPFVPGEARFVSRPGSPGMHPWAMVWVPQREISPWGSLFRPPGWAGAATKNFSNILDFCTTYGRRETSSYRGATAGGGGRAEMLGLSFFSPCSP